MTIYKETLYLKCKFEYLTLFNLHSVWTPFIYKLSPQQFVSAPAPHSLIAAQLIQILVL